MIWGRRRGRNSKNLGSLTQYWFGATPVFILLIFFCFFFPCFLHPPVQPSFLFDSVL